MINRKRRWVGRVLRAVPTPMREFAVRRTTPSYVMGAMCRLERDDGRVLLVKPSYRTVWTLPGGVSERGESPIDCMHRELREETGLRCEVIGEPVVMLDPKYRIFDFVYQARLAPDVRPDDARGVARDRRGRMVRARGDPRNHRAIRPQGVPGRPRPRRRTRRDRPTARNSKPRVVAQAIA